MKVAMGRVVAGKVIVEGEPIPDGSTVTVIARDDDETFKLSPEEEEEILSAIAEADRRDTIDADQLLKSLGPRS